MNQVTLTADENTGSIPVLKQGDAKNTSMSVIPCVDAADLIGLRWIFADYYHYPLHLSYAERRCAVIE